MKPLLIKSDVMALKCIQDYVFAGIGNELQVLKDSELKIKTTIFENQKIHGFNFSENENIILIFGGREIKLFHFDATELTFNEIYHFKSNDWILSAVITSNNKFVLVTAHNVVILFDFVNKVQKYNECEEKCILYSAFIEHKENEKIIILAGTVFSEILIWQPWNNSHSTIASPVIYRLIGHKGVIFSITYNPDEKLICSTSDDRTVRLWNVNSNTIYDALQQPNKKISLKCSLYGHIARVWSSLIVKNKVISVGEDSQIIIWDTCGNIIRKFKAHQNDCIWCLDYYKSQDLILSGGGDCGLNGHYLDLTKWFELNTLPVLNNDQEVIKKVALMYKENIVAITEIGTLLFFNKAENLWKIINRHETSKNILLETSFDKMKVIIAGNDGKLLIYKQNIDTLSLFNVTTSSNLEPILSVHWLTNSDILYCTPNGNLVKYGTDENKHSRGILPYSKERWVTCAILINSQCLIIGDRMGSIYVYKEDFISDNIFKLNLIQTFNKIHGRLGVSCLVMNMYNQLLSTGRNGIVNKYSISPITCQLNLLSSVKTPFKWCTKIIPKCENEKLPEIICGFFESNFVMWALDLQQTVIEINCSGGHRSWDYLFTEDNRFLYIYVKNKSVHCISCTTSFLLSRVYLQNFHSMEINCMIFIKQFNVFVSGGEDTTLRISAINKTTSNCDEIYFDIRSVSVLRTHLSNIRALEVCSNNNNILLFSGGGRAQLIIYELSLWNNTVECTPKIQHILKNNRSSNTYPNDTETRIMDIKVRKTSSVCIIVVGCSDGILRIYSLKIINEQYIIKLEFYLEYHKKCILKVGILESENYFIVTSMATDGKIAFWNLTVMLKDQIFSFLNQTVNENVSNITNSQDYSFPSLKPCKVICTHQSGINSFCTKKLQNNIHLIITGGDDATISVTIIKVNNNVEMFSITELAILQIVVYHAAQITGLLLFDEYLISTSTDQRITVLKLNISTSCDSINYNYIEHYCSSIADIQGICLTEVNKKESLIKCCIYGKGIEILEIKIPKSE